jgi:hypothetical protein
MNIYVLIGFNFSDNLILNESDKLLYKNIYVVSKPGVTDAENVEIVSDQNILKFYKNMSFESSDENIIFIDCRKHKDIKCYFDIMYFLRTERFDKRSYYIMKGNTIKLADYPLVNHFDPWTGDKIPSKLSEKKHIQDMFKVLATVARAYLKAGFHKYNGINVPVIENIPDGWMMNVGTPEIEHIINYYEMFPITPDTNRALEFIHNAQYRYIVTDTIVKVVANYLVRNDVISSVTIDDWFNYKNWDIQKLNFYF